MRKKAALYDPYLDILGGGEKHILSVLKVLEEHNFEPQIFWNNDLSLQMKERLNLHFTNLTYRPNIFTQPSSQIQKLLLLKDIDIFLYVTDGSYFLSTAKKNYIFSMVPQKKLYPHKFIDRVKTSNYSFISNSQFTKKKLTDWKIKSEVLYPYIDNEFITIGSQQLPKDKLILSVGRFFSHLHSKKHDQIITTFRQLKQRYSEFSDYNLILAGSAKNEDEKYLGTLKKLIGNDQTIKLEVNIPFRKLLDHYKAAQYYWHFTGYGVNENEHPEQVEHLGITPLEAMATGAITFCYNAGGPKEIIVPDKTGYLFDTSEELLQQMKQIQTDTQKQGDIRQEVTQFINQYFSYGAFANNVSTIFNL